MKTRQKALEMVLSVALCFALLCTVMVNLNYQVFAKNVAGCSTTNPQTYGEWLDVVPENGTFEAGYPGTDVYGWHLTAMSYGYTRLEDVNHSETDIQNYLNSYTLKTEKQDGNKYAVIRKDGGGYVALTSQPFKVNGGQVYKLKLDYFLRNIINPKENKLDTDFHGIRICMREYDIDGNATWTKLNYNGDEQGKILASDYNGNSFTSDDWKTINTGFIPAATTIKVELYIRVGGVGDVFGDVLFDNIFVSEYDYFELQNGNFDAVTYVGEAGRGNEILGPAGWTTISCTAGGAVTTENYVNSYAATIVPDPDNVNNPVLKYQYKNLTSTGYAFIQSPSVPVVADSKFSASFRYKITEQMAYTPKATVFFYDADGNEISRHHTNLNKSQPQWLSKTTSEFTVPANAVSAKIGFFGSRQNSVSSLSYPAEYIYSEGGRNFDTYTLYFDDIIINGANSEWTSETTKTNGAPRSDSYDYTGHYTIEKVTDGVTHKNALLLRASSSENGIGAVTYYSKPIKVEANTSYTATFDLKIEGFKADAETTYGPMQARLFARYLDANGKVINTTPSIVYQSGYQDRDWTSYNNSFTTNGDAVAVQIGLLCGVTNKNTWDNLTFYWDNIRVVKTTEFDVRKAEKFDKTDLLFISMQGGNADDETNTVDLRDLIRLKRYINKSALEGEITIEETADMNKNKCYNEDDIKLLRWKLLGFTTEEEIKNGHPSAASVLNEKKILFCGDSITRGVNASNNLSWADKTATLTGAIVTKAGQGGATVAYDRSDVDPESSLYNKGKIIDQLHNYSNNNYDYVILHGGVNDAGNHSNIPVGELTEGFDLANFNGKTFAGGLESMIYYAYTYFPNAKIGYIVNFQTCQDNLADYMDVAKQVCDKWNVPYIDLFAGTVTVNGQELSYSLDILDMDNRTYISEPDNPNDVHINEQGYNVITPYIIEWIAALTSNLNPL